MAQFMVEFDLPIPYSEEFLMKIPLQKIVVDELMEAGKIISYALSIDRGRLWMILDAKTEMEVLEVINKFPLIKEMDYTITELMFNHAGAIQVPAFSLN